MFEDAAGMAGDEAHSVGQMRGQVFEGEEIEILDAGPGIALEVVPGHDSAAVFVRPGPGSRVRRPVGAFQAALEKRQALFEAHEIVAQAQPEDNEIVQKGLLRFPVGAIVHPTAAQQFRQNGLHHRGVDQVFDEERFFRPGPAHQSVDEPDGVGPGGGERQVSKRRHLQAMISRAMGRRLNSEAMLRP